MHASRVYLGGVSALTLLAACGGALAQDAGGAQLEEVVVTAQRRSEVLTNVPASITAVSSERLRQANIQSSLDLTKVTPGVSLDPRGGFAQPTIRGVGTTITSIGNAANVAVYLDGIYQVSQRANFFDVGALEQLQVLKGPQGTLYGRNATGGAILITTKNPTRDPSADFYASYGRFNDRRFTAYVNGPLGDTVAANLSLVYHKDDGNLTFANSGHKAKNYDDLILRAKVRWQPSDTFDYTLSGDYGSFDDPGTTASTIYNNNHISRRNNPTLNFTDPSKSYISFDGTQWTKTQGVTGRGDLHLKNVDITSYSGYRSVWGQSIFDTDAGPPPLSKLDWHQQEDNYSQEFQATSTHSGPLQYLAGVIYIREIATYDPYLSNNVLTALTRTVTQSYSAYAELTYNVTDKLTVVGGARYTKEEIDYKGRRAYGGPLVVDRNTKYETVTPRLSVRYEIVPHTNVYATYNKGFKSGGNNTSALNNAPPFNPEKITSYEVGVKSRPTSRLSLEAAAFFYDYKDIQITASVPSTSPLPGGFTGNLIYNAAAAKIRGLDLSGEFAATADLRLTAGLSWIPTAKYTSFPSALITTPETSPTVCGAGVTPPCGNRQFVADVSGKRMIRTPKLTTSVGFNYGHDISLGRVELNGNVYYSSGFWAEPSNRLGQGAYTVLDGTLSFAPAGSHYKFSVWGRNLTNEKYAYSFIDSALYDTVRWALPRTYGVAISAHF
ncbi:MAG: tonB dependent receptor family protein [Phenylobacterium sp.]|nr:tonB dependent receptor family protein [Phenylobacterium sp.]